jgi:hypothetical protein
VKLARCLFADFDGGTDYEDAMSRIKAADLPWPTAILESGGGIHAWWRLDHPMTDAEAWHVRMKAIASALGSDQSICDWPRIMRLPGFINWKHEQRPLSVLKDCDPTRVYPLARLARQAVQSVVVTPGASFKLDDHWRVNARFLLQFSGENDADVGDSATYGGILAASYTFSREFTLGLGVLATSRIEDDALVVPQIIIDWRPCKEFRLSNFAGPEAFPGGAGLEAIWILSEEFEVALGGRYTYRRFRLADDAPVSSGVGTDEGLPIWLRATMRAKCGARIDLVGGFQFAGEMQIDDSAGRELAKVDVESAPFLGAFFSWKF